MFLYLAPWEWVTEGGQSFWRMPRADIGLGSLDLRSLPQCGSPGPAPQGYGLFALSQQANIGYYLGDSFEGLLTTARKRALKTALTLGEDIIADTPLGALLELLNRYADPTGATRWKPLRGSLQRGVTLRLAGQSWDWKLDAVILANTIAVFQADYRRNKLDGVSLAALRKWTGSTMLSLWGQMSDELAAQLLPPEYAADGWEAPSTVFTESFNQPDSTILGPNLTWTEVLGDWSTVANRVALSYIGGDASARAEHDLSSADHYAKIDIYTLVANQGFGAAARFAPAATTYYTAWIWNLNEFWLSKVVTGTRTNLVSTIITLTLPDTVKAEINASTLKAYLNDVEKLSTTDAAITGNLRAGLGLDYGNGIVGDNFEAGDLAAAGRIMGALAGHGGLAGAGGIAGKRGGLAGN